MNSAMNKYLKNKGKTENKKKNYNRKQKKNLNKDSHHDSEVNHGKITKLSFHNLKY